MAGKDPWSVTRLLIGVRGGALDSILIDDSTASMDRPRDHDARRCALKLRERGRNAGPRRYVRAETVSAGRGRGTGTSRRGTNSLGTEAVSEGGRVLCALGEGGPYSTEDRKARVRSLAGRSRTSEGMPRSTTTPPSMKIS